MPRKKKPAEEPKQDETDWSEEPAGGEAEGDLSTEELEALETEAGGDPDAAEEEPREEAEGGEREEGREEERRAEADDEGPRDLDEARDMISNLESRRRREKKSLRRTIADLRADRRQRRLEGDVVPPADEKPVELPDNIEFEIDESGKPVLPKEKFKQYVKAAEKDPEADRLAIRRRLEGMRDQAQERYTEIREDYLDEVEDPDIAEAAIERLEGAYQWLNKKVLKELRRGAPPPRNSDETLELIEDAGIDEDFEDRYPGVLPSELIEAPSDKRKFARLVERELDEAEKGDRPRSRRRLRDDDEDDERPRRRRSSRRREDEDDDERPRSRRSSERGSARVGLRSTSRRSMRRRGASGVKAEGNVPLERYGKMDVEDFLSLPREEIQKVERMAGKPPPRRRR